MTWVRRARPPAHVCAPPSHVSHGYVNVPVGAVGDLWRCDDCHTLWRIGDACDTCDHFGSWPHPGGHEIGTKWRPATLWQRLRYRRSR